MTTLHKFPDDSMPFPCLSNKWSQRQLRYCYTASTLGRYQITLLVVRDTCLWTTCPELLHGSKKWPKVKPTTSRLRVRCTNHYTNKQWLITNLATLNKSEWLSDWSDIWMQSTDETAGSNSHCMMRQSCTITSV